MKRVIILIAFMLIGFTSCDPDTQPYASHFIHDGYKVMYGEYEVTSVICFQEEIPEHLIESAAEKIPEDRLSFEMQVSAHEDKTKSYGTPWVYQYFQIEEGNMSYHYGIRYGLIYCE